MSCLCPPSPAIPHVSAEKLATLAAVSLQVTLRQFCADACSAEHARLDEFLNQADVGHRWVVLGTDPALATGSPGAQRCAWHVGAPCPKRA